MYCVVISEDEQALETLANVKIKIRSLRHPLDISKENLNLYNIALLDTDNEDVFLVFDILTHSNIKIIAFGTSSPQRIVRAIKSGAISFMPKPLTKEAINNTLSEIKHHLTRSDTVDAKGEELIGESPKMVEVKRLIKMAARSDSNVLITGESGTGKEPVAKLIHKNSPRRNNLFMTINCSAIPDTLLESELFGFEKGSFTGANYTKKGMIELAHLGTVFLDEIGDVSPLFQTKILRVLQEGEIMRIGGSKNIKVDVRFICATNKDLTKQCKMGTFREDLFYRINVINIHMPPLRERKEDIPLLINHFIKKYAPKRADINIEGIDKDAVEILIQHNYPGNVRELENIVERAISFTETPIIDKHSLPQYLMNIRRSRMQETNKIRDIISNYERELIWSALQDSQGNITKAAQLLGIHRQELQRKIRKFKIAT
ncbi:MAG: sigma-54 dependent transcriptional regulator [Thermodesulfovibrionales bacterium]|nr:sigma-54 dependent transcriptional regulator [Thermodesulfovibrionales bacterium]